MFTGNSQISILLLPQTNSDCALFPFELVLLLTQFVLIDKSINYSKGYRFWYDLRILHIPFIGSAFKLGSAFTGALISGLVNPDICELGNKTQFR